MMTIPFKISLDRTKVKLNLTLLEFAHSFSNIKNSIGKCNVGMLVQMVNIHCIISYDHRVEVNMCRTYVMFTP